MYSSILFGQNKVDSILFSFQNKSTIEKIKVPNEFCWNNRNIVPEFSTDAAYWLIKWEGRIFIIKKNDIKNVIPERVEDLLITRKFYDVNEIVTHFNI